MTKPSDADEAIWQKQWRKAGLADERAARRENLSRIFHAATSWLLKRLAVFADALVISIGVFCAWKIVFGL